MYLESYINAVSVSKVNMFSCRKSLSLGIWREERTRLLFIKNHISNLKLGIDSYFDFIIVSVVKVELSIKLTLKYGWEPVMVSCDSIVSVGSCWAGRPFRKKGEPLQLLSITKG